MVVVVGAQMLCESVDTRSEDRDLNFGRTGVALVCAILFDDLLLFVFLHHCGIHLYIKFERTLSQSKATGG